MNRSSRERMEILDSRSPLDKHSINQDRIKRSDEGQRRIERELPRKAQRASSRSENRRFRSLAAGVINFDLGNDELVQIAAHELEKNLNVLDMVTAVKRRLYDGADAYIIDAATRYLSNRGIHWRNVLSS